MRRILCLLVAFALVAPASVTAKKQKVKRDRYQRWVETEVVYIISDYEKKRFLALTDDRDKKAFMEAFWKVRDPTPATRQNEYKQEHLKRIATANSLFGRSKKRPGWNSERGRMWIQLGEPQYREVFSMERRLYPIEHWFYQGDKELGLPPFFNVIFYQPYGSGQWELYDPSIDGPNKLVGGIQASGFSSTAPGSRDYRRLALQDLHGVSPELARASLNLDPSEPYDDIDLMPSMANRRLVAKLSNLENTQPVDKAYVDRIGEAEVTVEYSFKHLGMKATFHGAYLPAGGSVLHYAIEIPPESLTLREHENRIGGALEVVGRVFEEDGQTPVLQIDERVEISLSREELRKLLRHPFAFEDVVPLLPGKYTASLVVRNLVSKEFGVIDGTFEIPARDPKKLAMSPILLASTEKKKSNDDVRPFVIGDTSWYPAQSNIIQTKSDLTAVYQVAYPVGDYSMGDKLDVRYVITSGNGEERKAGFDQIKLNPVYDRGIIVGTVRTPLVDMAPDRYSLAITVTDKKKRRVTGRVDFVASFAFSNARPWLYVAARPTAPGALALSFAEQHLLRGNEKAALTAFEAAAKNRRFEPQARRRLAELHLKRREYKLALAAIEPVALGDMAATHAVLMLGLARSGTGDSKGAIEAYQRAAEKDPRSTRILNVLGEEWMRMGDDAKAKASFDRSLAIDKDQPKVKTLLATLGKSPPSQAN